MASRDKVPPGLQYMGFGMEFAGIIVAAVFVGYHLDERLGTTPWLVLLFTLAGMAGAVRRLLWSLKKHTSPGNSG